MLLISSGVSLQVACQRYLLASCISIHKHDTCIYSGISLQVACQQYLLASGIYIPKHSAYIQRYLLTGSSHAVSPGQWYIHTQTCCLYLEVFPYRQLASGISSGISWLAVYPHTNMLLMSSGISLQVALLRYIQRYLLTSNAYIQPYLLSGSLLAVYLAVSTYKYSLLVLQYTLKLTLYIAMCCISLFANLMRKWKLCILHIFFVSPLPIVLNNSQKATKVSLKSSKAIESKSNLGKQIVLRTMAHFECQYALGSSII